MQFENLIWREEMDYIVMDLEWNQNPYGKSNHHPDIPFELLKLVR